MTFTIDSVLLINDRMRKRSLYLCISFSACWPEIQGEFPRLCRFALFSAEPVPFTCSSTCSSHLLFDLFLSLAVRPVPLTCCSTCSSHLLFDLFLSLAVRPVPLPCCSTCSSHLLFDLIAYFLLEIILESRVPECCYLFYVMVRFVSVFFMMIRFYVWYQRFIYSS